jgi:hypothetical protein
VRPSVNSLHVFHVESNHLRSRHAEVFFQWARWLGPLCGISKGVGQFKRVPMSQRPGFGDLGFGILEPVVDGADAGTMVVRVEHDLMRFVLTLLEDVLQQIDDKFHGCVVVVPHQDSVRHRPGSSGDLFDVSLQQSPAGKPVLARNDPLGVVQLHVGGAERVRRQIGKARMMGTETGDRVALMTAKRLEEILRALALLSEVRLLGKRGRVDVGHSTLLSSRLGPQNQAERRG